MARQRGIFKVEGTLGDVTFLKTQDGFLVKEKTSLKASRIASDPAFARTRENNAEFGRAGKATKLLRTVFRSLLQNARDTKLVSRLTKEMMRVIKEDATSTRGMRNVMDGETELLEGFNFNIRAVLSATFFARYTATVDRVSGQLEVSIPPFVPANEITVPEGATHYRLVSGGASVNFESQEYVEDSSQTGIMPINAVPTAAISLANQVTSASTHPLFLLLGIQFYQEVNGGYYSLKNGAFNPLSLVKVSGS